MVQLSCARVCVRACVRACRVSCAVLTKCHARACACQRAIRMVKVRKELYTCVCACLKSLIRVCKTQAGIDSVIVCLCVNVHFFCVCELLFFLFFFWSSEFVLFV